MNLAQTVDAELVRDRAITSVLAFPRARCVLVAPSTRVTYYQCADEPEPGCRQNGQPKVPHAKPVRLRNGKLGTSLKLMRLLDKASAPTSCAQLVTQLRQSADHIGSTLSNLRRQQFLDHAGPCPPYDWSITPAGRAALREYEARKG